MQLMNSGDESKGFTLPEIGTSASVKANGGGNRPSMMSTQTIKPTGGAGFSAASSSSGFDRVSRRQTLNNAEGNRPPLYVPGKREDPAPA